MVCELITDPIDSQDMSEPADTADPIANAEATDPIEPMLKAGPTEPMLSTDPVEAIDNIDPSEAIDHFDADIAGSILLRTRDRTKDTVRAELPGRHSFTRCALGLRARATSRRRAAPRMLP